MSPRVKSEIDMTMVKGFIKFIGVFSLVIMVLTLAGFAMATKSEINKVIYTMVLVINIIVTLGSFISLKLLKDK